MLKKEKKNVYVAKNGDTGEKRKLIKATQSYEYIVSIIFKDKIHFPIILLLFWITQGSLSRAKPYFSSKKYILLSNTRNCMLKGIWNLDLSIYF